MVIESEEQLHRVIWETVHSTPVFDVHTHLYDARFRESHLLWGIDELLTYHYLVAELFRTHPADVEDPETPLTPEAFHEMEKTAQAELIWRKLFLESSPVSEACRGVLTSLGMHKLDPGCRDLATYRYYFASRPVEEHIDYVFSAETLEGVVMTNNPFEEAERAIWLAEEPGDPRFHAAMRIDPLLHDWANVYKRMKEWGYKVKKTVDRATVKEVQRFLADWCEIMNPLYLATSFGPDLDPEDKSDCAKLLTRAVLPFCAERGVPYAPMIGVKKLVNPDLNVAGDGVGKADIGVVEGLCRDYPEVKFLVTMLSRENQHELCVAARKFANLMPFGCWWFLNDPMTIDEMTRMRLELLGLSFIPQHSDARVLDQLLYKWAHSRWIVAHVLIDKYSDLQRTGWRVTEEEIARDVANLFGGNFKRFVGLA